jgi:protein-tyrosine phosphatase
MAIPDGEPAPSLAWLRDAVEFIEEHRGKDRPTYVHCFAGISRSAMVTTAYLMKKNNWSRDDALAYIRKSRPIVNPNPAFMKLLAEWGKR